MKNKKIIGIIIAAIIMFLVPLILIADRSDDISQLVVQTATAEFVNDIIKSGKITTKEYANLKNMLATTGNSYDVDIEVEILDYNTAQRYTTDPEHTENAFDSGNKNTYYSIYTSQIEERLRKSDYYDDETYNDTGALILKEGDSISVTVKNTSATLSQSLKNIYYKVKGEDVHIILVTASGTIAINGAT